jgi:predicted nucleic acid-binding protein
MTGRLFVDTNLLLYQFDTREPDKQVRARDWMEYLWSARTGLVSFQVLQEFYSIATRKLDPGLSAEEARKVVRALWAWRPMGVNERVFLTAWAFQDRFGLSWWDALIVAAARLAECSHLLTEDLQHGQDLDGLRVVNPFRVSPDALISSGLS